MAGREAANVELIEKYLRAVGMFRDYSDSTQDPTFSQVTWPPALGHMTSCPGLLHEN